MTTEPLDPADAAALAAKLAGPDVARHFTEAAIRDICRRAAYDLGLQNRQAHPDYLPILADEAAARLRKEAAPAMAREYRDQLQTVLQKSGWARRFDSFEQQDGAAFDLGFQYYPETLTVHMSRPKGIVETFHLDAAKTPPARLARIITAATE
jgi:hypothetical protein